MSTEDKKAAIKQLIDLIPTEKSQLFAWKMDWDQVDQVYYHKGLDWNVCMDLAQTDSDLTKMP